MNTIETERLVLRRFAPQDAAGLFAYLQAPIASCFLSLTLADLNDAARAVAERGADDKSIAVCLRSTGQLIGDLFAEPEGDTFSVGWNFNPQYAGRGYAHEAASALFADLFTRRAARRLYAYVEDTNTSSQKLCERLACARKAPSRNSCRSRTTRRAHPSTKTPCSTPCCAMNGSASRRAEIKSATSLRRASTPRGCATMAAMTDTPSTSPVPPAARVALIIGAGDATGGAIAKRFAREGYMACVTRRSADKLQPLVDAITAAGGQARGFASDARKEEDVVALIEQIEREVGPIEVLVFNIGANVPCSILEETARKYFKIWEMACFSGFLNAREVARRQVQRGRGTILFTGATAGTRGAAGFAAFAGAKHALRALAQSMARELGPRGIHVGHVVVDGAIDTEFIRTQFPERYALKDQDGILNPDHIAENYWYLHQQPRDAWTFELDLRPYMETW